MLNVRNNNTNNKRNSNFSKSENNLISILNADLSNKQKELINSPRTIKACLHLGISIEELYKKTFEEFKSKNMI